MATELTLAKLAELRQKAEAAEKKSPSPWHGGPDGDDAWPVTGKRGKRSPRLLGRSDPAPSSRGQRFGCVNRGVLLAFVGRLSLNVDREAFRS